MLRYVIAREPAGSPQLVDGATVEHPGEEVRAGRIGEVVALTKPEDHLAGIIQRSRKDPFDAKSGQHRVGSDRQWFAMAE